MVSQRSLLHGPMANISLTFCHSDKHNRRTSACYLASSALPLAWRDCVLSLLWVDRDLRSVECAACDEPRLHGGPITETVSPPGLTWQ
ncbi:hypothetical protein RRG08_012089 [Elysia crispata]|uniref:Uncharacterized protein n=1 Tax=Elysia crispata TaxID=231223 RepID=A0AAE0YUB6_9GAST|nr:hypothetical protein RRG08_012089 [Elysia crispata]